MDQRGGPAGSAVGWLNTKKYRETGTTKASQGWAPLVIDTRQRQARRVCRADKPFDPTKQKRIIAGMYGVQPSPTDGSIWGQSMDVGFSRMPSRATSSASSPAADPTNTA